MFFANYFCQISSADDQADNCYELQEKGFKEQCKLIVLSCIVLRDISHCNTRQQRSKTFFMLNSTEHEISTARKN